MKTLLTTVAAFFLFSSTAHAGTRDFHIEYAYDDIDIISKATLYSDGVKLCESAGNALTFDCAGNIKPGTHNFTLTVSNADGVESAHSQPVEKFVDLGSPVIIRVEIISNVKVEVISK